MKINRKRSIWNYIVMASFTFSLSMSPVFAADSDTESAGKEDKKQDKKEEKKEDKKEDKKDKKEDKKKKDTVYKVLDALSSAFAP